jgi:hypothetical protein
MARFALVKRDTLLLSKREVPINRLIPRKHLRNDDRSVVPA